MHPTIYLAGPISGLSYDRSETWRDDFIRRIPSGIACFSPLRAKQYLRSQGVLEQSYAQPLSSDRGIMTRDHFDCARASLIVCNLAGAERVSIGTVMEVAWAHAYRKPLIAILEEGSVHDHPMIREAVGFRASDVAHAAEMATGILLPGGTDWPAGLG